ncbi:unnamed protein product [Trichobilharzia szidati]|nr:unnamed protein product [Trichobilharzia szidati]
MKMLNTEEINSEESVDSLSESISYNSVDSTYAIDSINDAIIMLTNEPIFSNLFSEDEQKWLEKFKCISNKSKSLALRLYGRSQKIFRKVDILKLIQNDADQCLNELNTLGLLSTDLQMLSVDLLIDSLNRQELDQLAGMYNIKNYKSMIMSQLKHTLLKTSSVSPMASFFKVPTPPKDRLKSQIIRILDGCWRVDESSMQLITRIIWLTSLGSESAYNRPNKLHSIEALLKTELYAMLLVRRKELIYPTYILNRKSIIYRTSDELQKFLEFMQLEIRLEYLISQKSYDSALKLCLDKKAELIHEITNLSCRRIDLPQFLRRFTSPYRALRCLLLMIDIYERQRSYSEATELIELLLSLSWSNCDDPFLKIASSSTTRTTSPSTSLYCVLDQLGPCRLGHLLNRYIINQATHRKQPIHALKHIHNYFKLYNNCLCLRAGRRLTICDQLIKLYNNNILKEVKQKQSTVTMDSDNDDGYDDGDKKIKSKAHCKKRRRIVKPKNGNIKNCNSNDNNNCDHKIEEDLLTSIPALQMDIKEAPKVEIIAPVNATAKEIGTNRPHYVWFETLSPSKLQNGQKSHEKRNTLLLTVEQWTVRYYMANKNFERGIHCESQIYHLLFTMLFYDILFEISPCPMDVFYSYRQSAPLDLFTDEFYQSRKDLIDARLEWIINAEELDNESSNSIEFRITTYWNEHHGENCLWANWDLLNNSQELIDIFWCLGPQCVHSVCQKLATDYRSWRSGLPDLLLWSPIEKRAKIVEVKGPGDHLSNQQIMWLDVFVRAKADVEICLVSAKGIKSLNSNFKTISNVIDERS